VISYDGHVSIDPSPPDLARAIGVEVSNDPLTGESFACLMEPGYARVVVIAVASIESTPNIFLGLHTEVIGAPGQETLESIVLADRATSASRRRPLHRDRWRTQHGGGCLTRSPATKPVTSSPVATSSSSLS
jgi:hypothetical protein